MDIENLLYVVLALVFIVSKVMKARKQKQAPGHTDQAESKTKLQVTFEDLLKEYGGRQPQQEEEVPEPVVEGVVDSREIISDDEKKPIFQKSIDEAASYSTKKEKPEVMSSKAFKAYQIDSESGNEFAEEIREMLIAGDGGKKAIVLGEILNRKY